MPDYGCNEEFINEEYIEELLESAKRVSDDEIGKILDKADRFEGLSHREVAALLQTEDEKHAARIFEVAGKIKKHIYGDRVVLFAPLYVSDYCINKCLYCGFRHDHDFPRRKLTMDEVMEEVRILESMGHKRLAVEAGEDPVNCPIEYIEEVLRTIYGMKFKNGEIRRVNVNIAATTVENYRRLKNAGIGTYILFQETYHRPTYEKLHAAGPKRDYYYHLTAFDRAQMGGIDDVGGGVLFGLYDYKFEVLALMLHNEHLEKRFNVGFHTISAPRVREADGADVTVAKYMPADQEFLKLVAIIRLAVPFTGIIISTRESVEMRKKLISIGVSQISGGSCVGVGGYSSGKRRMPQFAVSDERPMEQVIEWLMDKGLIPSFCTACYRKGRTGDRFMSLAKSGNIKNVCLPNALTTLCEYAQDYGDEKFRLKAEEVISMHLPEIQNEKVRKLVEGYIERIKAGERDLYV